MKRDAFRFVASAASGAVGLSYGLIGDPWGWAILALATLWMWDR